LYPVIAEPPLLDDGVHVREILFARTVAIRFLGTLGTEIPRLIGAAFTDLGKVKMRSRIKIRETLDFIRRDLRIASTAHFLFT